LAKDRLQICTNRFFNARRVAECEVRDERATNELVLAEVFEVEGFLGPSHNPGFCSVTLRNNLVVTTLPLPEQLQDQAPRRTPLALPYPCNIVHTIEVLSPALRPFSNQRSAVEGPFLKFNRNHKSLTGYWSVTLTLSTLVDAVPAERFDEYRRTVEEVWQESMWSLHIEVGYPRPRRRSDFGSLPAASKPATLRPRTPIARLASNTRAAEAASASSADVEVANVTGRGQATEAAAAQSALVSAPTHAGRPSSRRRPHRRHRSRRGTGVLWPIIISVVIVGLVVLFIFVVRR
jgi:hypothetical protein